MWSEEKMLKDTAALLFDAISENDEDLEELDLSDLLPGGSGKVRPERMANLLIPTLSLRFVERKVPAPELGDNLSRTARVLQQRLEFPGGSHAWQGMPLVSEPQL